MNVGERESAALAAAAQGGQQRRFIDLESIAAGGPVVVVAALLHLVAALERNGDSGTAAVLREQADAARRRLGICQPGLHEPGAPELPKPFAALTDREREIARLIVGGLSYEQVARRLGITKSTVSFHLAKVYAKTNTRRRHDLVELIQAGWLRAEPDVPADPDTPAEP